MLSLEQVFFLENSFLEQVKSAVDSFWSQKGYRLEMASVVF